MINSGRFGIAVVAMATAIGLVVGCGGDPAPAAGVDIEMFGWVENPSGGMEGCEKLSNYRGGYCDRLTKYPDAHVLNVKLTQPHSHQILSRSQHDIGSGEATISGLQVGEGLRLDFDLVGEDGGRLASGATPMFDLTPGASDKSFHTMLMPAETFAPVGARYGAPNTEKSWAYEPSTFDGRVSEGKYIGRVGHQTATTEAGNVLIVGGGHHSASRKPWTIPSLRTALGDVQLFEPSNGYVTDLSLDPTSVPPAGEAERRPDGGGRLSVARAYHTVTPIGDDKYVVIGGFTRDNGETSPTAAIELIDMTAEPGNRVEPLDDADGNAVELNVARAFHTATYRRENNHIVIAGGVGDDGVQDVLKSVEVLSFADGISVEKKGELNEARAQHEAVLLGEEGAPIWVIGGRGPTPPDGLVARVSTEVIRAGRGGVATENLSASMNVGRYELAAERVGPTQVLICGGFTSTEADSNYGDPTDTCQVGNRQQERWSQPWAMQMARGGLEMVALTQSRDLTVIGGRDAGGTTVDQPTRMIYQQGQSPPYDAEMKSASMHRARYSATVTHLRSGMVLLAGGIGDVEGQRAPLRNMEYYNPLDIVRSQNIDTDDDSENGESDTNDNGGKTDG